MQRVNDSMDVFFIFHPRSAVIQNTSHLPIESYSEPPFPYSCRAAVKNFWRELGDRLGNIRYLYLHAELSCDLFYIPVVSSC